MGVDVLGKTRELADGHDCAAIKLYDPPFDLDLWCRATGAVRIIRYSSRPTAMILVICAGTLLGQARRRPVPGCAPCRGLVHDSTSQHNWAAVTEIPCSATRVISRTALAHWRPRSRAAPDTSISRHRRRHSGGGVRGTPPRSRKDRSDVPPSRRTRTRIDHGRVQSIWSVRTDALPQRRERGLPGGPE